MEHNKFICNLNSTARDILIIINGIAAPGLALFVVDYNNILLGAVTDGDIRRGLLNGLSIQDNITLFMNSKCKHLIAQGDDNFNRINEFKLNGIRFIPMLNALHEIVSIVDLHKINALIPADVVLMAGGKGERLKPLTNTTPKPMLKVGDTPIILRNIDRLCTFGIDNFHIAVRHMAEQIETGVAAYNLNNKNIRFVKENNPLGTIGAVKLISHFYNDTIIVMNSDLLTNIDFKDFYKKFITTNLDMLVATIPYHVDVPYAVMNVNDNNEVVSFSEKPRYTYYSNAGIYIFKKTLIELIPSEKAFDATHFMEAVIATGKKLGAYPILGYWLDIGRIDDFNKAQEDVKHIKF